MFHIYAIYCKANDKVYIGQTKMGVDRFTRHRYMLNKGTHPSAHLRNAWASYGAHSFEFFFLEEMPTREEANAAEQRYIEWYKSQGLSFNVMKGGEGPEHFSEEARAKMAEARKGLPLTDAQKSALEAGRQQNPYEFSEETKAKMRALKLGKPLSPEHREKSIAKLRSRVLTEDVRKKLSDANKGNQNFLGKHHSEETKQKLSEARKGEGNPMYGKPATEERKRKLSETTKGRPGKPLSEETKQKIKEARAKQTMKPMSQETKDKIAAKARERAALKRLSS